MNVGIPFNARVEIIEDESKEYVAPPSQMKKVGQQGKVANRKFSQNDCWYYRIRFDDETYLNFHEGMVKEIEP